MTPAVFAGATAWSIAMLQLARLPLSPIERARVFPWNASFCAILLATSLPFLCRTQPDAIGRAATLGMLVATGMVDYETGYIFDAATLPAAAIALLAAVAAGTTTSAIQGLCLIGLPIAILAAWSRGTWIAWGDIKAILSIVIAFSLPESLATLMLASCTGIVHVCAVRSRSIPFGPHMAFGAAVAAVLGPIINPMFAEG
jgi:prepilin signal peptidase PulO-like enzyme (type II secretory pathway)